MKKSVCKRVRFRMISPHGKEGHALRRDTDGRLRWWKINPHTLEETGPSQECKQDWKSFAEYDNAHNMGYWKELKKP